MYRLGIDIGSTTIKMALVEVESQKTKDRPSDSKPVVLATDYRRHNAEPMTKCANTSPAVNPKSSAWSKRFLNHRNNLPNMQNWYIFNEFVFVYLKKKQ